MTEERETYLRKVTEHTAYGPELWKEIELLRQVITTLEFELKSLRCQPRLYETYIQGNYWKPPGDQL
jgi:hypothetical protein